MRPPPPDAGLRLPREARLRTRRDFDRVFAEGRKLVNRQLVAWIAPAPAGGPSRIGLMVSKKVGDSPARNRVKRVLREAFRHLAPALPRSLEMVLLARPGSQPTTLEEARTALAHLLARHAKGHGDPPGAKRRTQGGRS
ncbi:MAG: ribonuclease P protein component [Planctomycetes bacterium]|nr:ribonuclease P protein component [Planctomycetota bacterium]